MPCSDLLDQYYILCFMSFSLICIVILMVGQGTGLQMRRHREQEPHWHTFSTNKVVKHLKTLQKACTDINIILAISFSYQYHNEQNSLLLFIWGLFRMSYSKQFYSNAYIWCFCINMESSIGEHHFYFFHNLIIFTQIS
jgi:hypothetical protein